MTDKEYFLNMIDDPETPVNITICGPYRFRNTKEKYDTYYSMKNNIIYMPIKYHLAVPDIETFDGASEYYEKMRRKVHFRKIDKSDAIIVVCNDENGFHIGHDTLLEISHAFEMKKKILFTDNVNNELSIFNHNKTYPLYMV